jgi:predicted nucleic acid-binding protein
MPFVLDASVAMAWCFEDEASPLSERVLDLLIADRAVVPDLWTQEVANVLLVAERRGRLSEADAARFAQLLVQLPIEVDSSPSHLATLLALGREHRLSAYDASYLSLAQRRGLALATLDATLAAAARQSGVALIAE